MLFSGRDSGQLIPLPPFMLQNSIFTCFDIWDVLIRLVLLLCCSVSFCLAGLCFNPGLIQQPCFLSPRLEPPESSARSERWHREPSPCVCLWTSDKFLPGLSAGPTCQLHIYPAAPHGSVGWTDGMWLMWVVGARETGHCDESNYEWAPRVFLEGTT